MRVICAISGISFQVPHIPNTTLPYTVGYYHPIFATPYRQLVALYSEHTKGKLTPTDSYLLFLAFLHSSGQVTYRVPVSLDPTNPSTSRLVENNFQQLVAVLEQTGAIQHPAFSQPSFVVTTDTSNLHPIVHWIEAWRENLYDFKNNRASQREYEALTKVENRLSRYILSGEPESNYASVIADWADKASGGFPANQAASYRRVILDCFNDDKMFSTPKPLLLELKDFCECNIEAGSIHFHTLNRVLRGGIHRHNDYLGGSSLALGYQILEANGTTLPDSLAAEIQDSADSLPAEPARGDYTTQLDFLRAKIAYRLAISKLKVARKIVTDNRGNVL